jgi:hypothetical protein
LYVNDLDVYDSGIVALLEQLALKEFDTGGKTLVVYPDTLRPPPPEIPELEPYTEGLYIPPAESRYVPIEIGASLDPCRR